MSCGKCKVKEYLKETKTIRLATIDKENHPVIRTLGAFVIEDYTVYFLTAKGTEKVEQIENNNNVAVLFEHENQIIPNFINVTVNGIAENIKDSDEFNRASKLIKDRKPHLDINQENSNIYKILPKKIKILDFTKENVEERIKIIKI